MKNLYFTTHRNPVQKAFEYTLAPLADFILGKRRVIELYLNVVEWGPGVYGAQAASEYHYHTDPVATRSRSGGETRGMPAGAAPPQTGEDEPIQRGDYGADE